MSVFSETAMRGNMVVEVRWCDNGDGTITDRTTGLVWLKKADWGAAYPFWADSIEKINAQDRASSLAAGTIGADLSDGSIEGDWHLPTLSELKSLTIGDDAVTTWDPQVFTNVEPTPYWTSTSDSGYPTRANFVHMISGEAGSFNKKTPYHVWPVRYAK